jgi:hypothetical protein
MVEVTAAYGLSVPKREHHPERTKADDLAAACAGSAVSVCFLRASLAGRDNDGARWGEGRCRALRACPTEDYQSWTSASPMMATPKTVDE